jgi:hypothetical protein
MHRSSRCLWVATGLALAWMTTAAPGSAQEAVLDVFAAQEADEAPLRDPLPPIDEHRVPPAGSFEGGTAVTCGPVFERYPVAGRHNNGYDPYWYVWNCSTANSNSDFHLGNDIFGARGTPIVAAQAGTISYSLEWDGSGGNVVYVVDDCGWWHYYAHLDTKDPALYLGKRVMAGARLGTLGNTGSASGTEPHLHYSTYPGNYGSGIDPWPYLYAVENGSCSSGNACSCLEGINVDGYTIPVTDTDCGHRVCGTSTETWQCNGSSWWKIGGAGSCNASCSCPNGRFKNGREIPEHMTHCGFRVCGMNNKFWDCTPGGWSNTQINCQ